MTSQKEPLVRGSRMTQEHRISYQFLFLFSIEAPFEGWQPIEPNISGIQTSVLGWEY